MSSMTGNMGMTSGIGLQGNKIPSGYKSGQMQQYTPEQMQLFQQLLSHVSPGSYLSRLAGGEEGLFEEMEAPAHRQFQGKLGEIASRFSGMGMGGRRGSGFQNVTTQATSDFAQDLQAKRQALQRQAILDLMGISSDLLGQRPYEQFLIKKQQKQPFWKKALGLVSPIGGDIAEGGTENTQNFLKALGMV